ncbi:tetratricopeptide repeat protein [Achromobacter mucicolens]|uniref:tetratricopeptide repeat protein n=1 Tax=Achromobacter mucicolens TaxID=1389922 RepID=UPI0007C85363|nr:tetratricopeptide repeat protein [Achromobacter mucicolens]OAE50084.1 peptidylprolyl isomerase [Achromobacter xylosoxidans]PTX10638.1 tetratricopeptide repeat protein [Achromobacter mucicolens]
MALSDVRGNPVSSDEPASMAAYERAQSLFHGYYGDPLRVIDEALADDPVFVMGHLLRAGMMITASDKCVEPLLRESVEAAEELYDIANERERRHSAAARAWLDGEFSRSLRRYADILADYPHDTLALQVGHIGDFLLGRSAMLRDRVAGILPAWDRSMPDFGYVLGMHAFGLEETNLYGPAEAQGRRALELNPRDPWAVHAVAHVLEMQGRVDEGIAWLTGRRDDWSADNMLAIHNWWHLALFHLDRDDIGDVLALYDSRLREASTGQVLDLVDASAMLWRLHLRGLDVGARWRQLADVWQARGGSGYYAFNDVHALMAYLGAGDGAAAQTLIESMEAAADGRGTNAMMTRDVGLPVAHALAAFARKDYALAVNLLRDVRLFAHRFGGSHAQRDVLALTLIEAALRDGARSLARVLAAERMALKPNSAGNRELAARAAAL